MTAFEFLPLLLASYMVVAAVAPRLRPNWQGSKKKLGTLSCAGAGAFLASLVLHRFISNEYLQLVVIFGAIAVLVAGLFSDRPWREKA